MGGFAGHTVSDEIRGFVEEGAIGGLILFARNLGTLSEVFELNRTLASLPGPAPLWLSVDQEGGRVQRLAAPFPQLPPMRALAPSGPEAVRAAGDRIGRALAWLGFNQSYAPVLDVDTNPANPVIGDRSFSADPGEVSRLGLAFIEGLEGAGIAGCAKHFPGHGDTTKDSHLELPRLDHPIERLESVELVPFAAAARAGVASMMTAHVVFAALDDRLPATLSSKVIEPILRDRFGYAGVVVSDDLEMNAIAEHFGIGEAAVMAIQAGCDQLLICHRADRIEEVFEALVQAAEYGALPHERLEQAAERVAAMKARFPRRAGPDAAEVCAQIDRLSTIA